jgi:hypothetical protein
VNTQTTINYSALFADWKGALAQGLPVSAPAPLWDNEACRTALYATLNPEGDTEEIWEDRWCYRRDEHYTVTVGIIASAGCDFGPLKLDCVDEGPRTKEGPWHLLPLEMADMIEDVMAEAIDEKISDLLPDDCYEEPDYDPEPYDDY